MTLLRCEQISLDDTSYCHCFRRCVRRAFLYGQDSSSTQNQDLRKQWVVDRLAVLSQVFAIDVCAYAVLSNHYHVVLCVDQALAQSWSLDEVAMRWGQLFALPLLVEPWTQGELTRAADQAKAQAMIESWRERFTSVSWFMRCINEHLAREANREDGVTGRFWEGRFKSQALRRRGGLDLHELCRPQSDPGRTR